MRHKIECERKSFNALARGTKTFEIRKNDRDYKVGDTLEILQLDKRGIISGKKIVFKISYLINDLRFVKKGFVTMGLKFSHQNWDSIGFLK